MIAYTIRRLLQLVPLLFVSSVLIFLILAFSPGDPVSSMLHEDAPEEQIEAARKALGLDQPLPMQYYSWISKVFQGDLGRSWISKRPVSELLLLSLPATFQLAVSSMILAIIISAVFGTIAALKANKPLDWLITSAASANLAIPNFWIGTMAILVFAVVLGWLPPGGRVNFSTDPIRAIKHLILPASIMAFRQTANLTRFVRTSVLEVMNQSYIQTARAKGLSEYSVMIRHVSRNSMIPVLTMIGILFGRLLAGSVIIETVFAWPGVGRMLIGGVLARDYPVVQGSLLVIVIIIVAINLFTDLLYGVIDPRIHIGEGKS